MTNIKSYLKQNKKRILGELLEFLSIPSVSAQVKYKKDVAKTAKFVADKLKEAGGQNIKTFSTSGHPIVYGEKIINKKLPTVLVYGHYDVQPVDPINLWINPPFKPIIKNNKIYARGSSDDKGQVFIHIKAFEYLLKEKKMHTNIKFVIEGEEEISSVNLEKFIRDHKQKLKADTTLISDTEILNENTPSITTGLRGLAYFEVEIIGPNRDLHSGFYDGVKLSLKEKNEITKIPFNLKKYKKQINITDIEGEDGFSTMERLCTRPSLDVNGVWGGYIEEGSKTVIPSKAHAKISMRLVPGQNPKIIKKNFIKYFKSLAPKSVRVNIKTFHASAALLTPTNSQEYKAASDAYKKAFGKKPLSVRGSASIPITNIFNEVLGATPLLLGFGLDTDAIHSPNEHFGIDRLFKGIETIVYFYENLN